MADKPGQAQEQPRCEQSRVVDLPSLPSHCSANLRHLSNVALHRVVDNCYASRRHCGRLSSAALLKALGWVLPAAQAADGQTDSMQGPCRLLSRVQGACSCCLRCVSGWGSPCKSMLATTHAYGRGRHAGRWVQHEIDGRHCTQHGLLKNQATRDGAMASTAVGTKGRLCAIVVHTRELQLLRHSLA